MSENYSQHTDEELKRAWNHLEKFLLTFIVKEKMDAIEKEQTRRTNRQSDITDIKPCWECGYDNFLNKSNRCRNCGNKI